MNQNQIARRVYLKSLEPPSFFTKHDWTKLMIDQGNFGFIKSNEMH